MKTADMTVLCVMGNKPEWQSGSGEDGPPADGAAQKTLRSNYMDGWCTEASINDTAI